MEILVPKICLDLVGLVALADLPAVQERTALAGRGNWHDILVLCPGMHRQQQATELNRGEYPATAALTTGYVFRIENQATVFFLQKVGKAGHLTTLSVQNVNESEYDPLGIFPDLYKVIVVLTSLSLGVLVVIDRWAMIIIGMLMTARLLNVLVIQARSSGPGWKGVREPGVHGDLLILLSQDRWIRMQGLVDDLKAITSGQWLRDPSFTERMIIHAATLIIYMAAALAINASKIGQIILLLLLLFSAGLLAFCNNSIDSLRMNGLIVQRHGQPKVYRRRLDLANELIEESGRDDWAIRLGMITPNVRADADHRHAAEKEEVTM